MFPNAVRTIAGGTAALAHQPLEQFEAVHARHHQIGDQHVRWKRHQLFHRILAIGGCLDAESPGRNQTCQRPALIVFVVDNQHASRDPRPRYSP